MKTLSLFSGAGGLDIGFHRAGFDIIGCVEIEKQYCETLKTNRDNGKYFNPEAKIYCEDIRSFKPEEFVNKKIECVIVAHLVSLSRQQEEDRAVCQECKMIEVCFLKVIAMFLKY